MPRRAGQSHDISYASAAQSRTGRGLIRLVENATGRRHLIRRADGYMNEIRAGADIWQVIAARYGLSLDVVAGSVTDIPRTGPVIMISNHPFGILDGLMMGRILSLRRGTDFGIIAHDVFAQAQDLRKHILPINFDQTALAHRENVSTRHDALRLLAAGGAVGVFPGGTVATAASPMGRPIDPVWRNFTAKLVLRSQATVVPVFFDGQNSRLFQIASHLHQTLRVALLIREFRARIDTPVRVAVGKPICQKDLRHLAHDPKALMDFLRARTYGLSPRPFPQGDYGHEFEKRYR